MLQYLILLVVFLLLTVIIVFIVIATNKNTTSSNKLPMTLHAHEYLSVVLSTSCLKSSAKLSELQEYCNKWHYHLVTSTDNTTTLILHDINKLNMRYDQSLDFFITLLRNVEYIGFYGSNNYFTRGTYRWQTINKEIQEELQHGELTHKIINNILAHGYPHSTANGLILSSDYLDLVLYGKLLPFALPCLIPNTIFARSTNVTNMSKIPKIIHQTFETSLLPAALKTAVDTWMGIINDKRL